MSVFKVPDSPRRQGCRLSHLVRGRGCEMKALHLTSGVVDPPLLGDLFGQFKAPLGESLRRGYSGRTTLKRPLKGEATRWVATGEHIPVAVLASHSPQLVSTGAQLAYAVTCSENVASDLALVLFAAGGYLAPIAPWLKLSPDLGDASIQLPSHLLASVFNDVSKADLPALASAWEERLLAAGLNASLKRNPGSRTLRVFPPLQQKGSWARDVAEWLASQPQTFWVEPVLNDVNFNSASSSVMRWGKSYRQHKDYLGTLPRTLNGSGQVVAVGDSGLDTSSCWFSDPAVPTPYMELAGLLPLQINSSQSAHRKLIGYLRTCAKSEDNEGWHGTHVSGTVAGSVPNEFKANQGVAPEAKLFFIDLSSSDDTLTCVPNNLYDGIFGVSHAMGARIHLHAWGRNGNVGQNSYSSRSLDADAFSWRHPDDLLIYAVGNSGPTLGYLPDPASAKNVLGVGAARIDGLKLLLGETFETTRYAPMGAHMHIGA